MTRPLDAHFPIFVKDSAGVPLYPGIEQYIARSGIEPLSDGTGVEVGNIGNATNIEDDAMNLGGSKHSVMECRNQRSTLSASGHIPVAEIDDDADATQFSQQCRIAQLKRIAVVWVVANRLAVAADRMN